jgi:hypothetical protein
MDNQVVGNSLSEQTYTVNNDLLESIKNFMDDLSTVTTNKNFQDYHTIVNRIDETKVKSYIKLMNGFKMFFKNNTDVLNSGNFNDLKDPNISYITDNGSFTFDFQKTFQEAEEADQDVIKDHLNHIWAILNNENKGPEEIYIDNVFKDLKTRFSPDMTREEQLMIAKDLFNDFQKQKLDISIVIKVACKKARELLTNNDTDENVKMLVLIDMVEEIDINNFDMIQFMGLITKISNLFSTAESNPLNSLLSSLVNVNPVPLDLETLNLDDYEEDEDVDEDVENEDFDDKWD